jgi:light-regulated signal transduction histidine kinase (bacteriophytochrome)
MARVEIATAALIGLGALALGLAMVLGWVLGRLRRPPARDEGTPPEPARAPAPASAAPTSTAPATNDPLDAEHLGFTLGHDLRAPVRVVEGFARILKEDYGAQLDRVANDHLDRVLGATARMNAMIDAILRLAQLSTQPLRRQPVNLSQLAGWVLDDLCRQQPERKVQLRVAPDLVAEGDPTLLRMVLENLLGNAWKYSARTPEAQIVFERTRHDGREVYVVRDNGVGFDMRGAERLFGLFQRLHSASEFPGHGVGLANVRRIVQRHGGQVWAASEPGHGASFYFALGG